MTASASLHHATSAYDLMLRHTHNMQDGDCIDVYEAIEDQCPHSDDETDVDVSSVSMSSTTTQEPVEIAFSASGGAFVYQMGIAAYMQEHFDLSECHFSGCSGGSWAATLLASDTDVNKAWSTIKNTRMRVVPGEASWYTGYGGRYSTIIADTIKDLWKNDPDVHLRVQKKKLAIAVTKFPSLKPERHTSWTDLEDLMKSILASALIPFALSGKPCIEHRGQWYVDGGITNFKGVNCEDYSTWGDIYYHGMNMAVDAVRSTTSAVAERFFPSLTKPVAKLINGLLPQVQSPHDAVAPRITNGAANPQCSSADTSDKSRPRILIMPWTWRSHHLTAFHLTLDMDTHQQRFNMGYEDARAHHEELATLLPPKSSIVAEV